MSESLYAIGATLAVFGGAITALVALRKSKPESDHIIVLAAKDAVIIQQGVLDRMSEALESQQLQMARFETRLSSQLQTAINAQKVAEEALAACVREREEERAHNRILTDRMEQLEAEVAKLRRGEVS